MIPKVIHQVWVGPHPVPVEVRESWRRHHPDYEFVLWNDDMVRHGGWRNQQLIDLMWARGNAWEGVSDLVRYEIMHRYGGIYVDVDSHCLAPIDRFVAGEGFLSRLDGHGNDKRGVRYGNAYLCTHPGDRLMEMCIRDVVLEPRVWAGAPSWIATGPKFITRMIEKHGTTLRRLPQFTFFPLSESHPVGATKSYAFHTGCTTHAVNHCYDEWYLEYLQRPNVRAFMERNENLPEGVDDEVAAEKQ